MPLCISAIPDDLDWKEAYLAAVLEKDPVRIGRLIEAAREKMVSRQCELIRDGLSWSDEAEAIHDAHYMLQALQSSLIYRDEMGRS